MDERSIRDFVLTCVSFRAPPLELGHRGTCLIFAKSTITFQNHVAQSYQKWYDIALDDETIARRLLCPAVRPRAGSGLAEKFVRRGSQDRRRRHQGCRVCMADWHAACRSLGRGLWEVRSSLTQGRIGRVLFCEHGGRMILLHAFIKKTQKTPASDLELASSEKGRSHEKSES